MLAAVQPIENEVIDRKSDSVEVFASAGRKITSRNEAIELSPPDHYPDTAVVALASPPIGTHALGAP